MNAQTVEPIVAPGHDNASVTRKITDVVLIRPTSRGWLGGFALAFLLLMLLNFAIGWHRTDYEMISAAVVGPAVRTASRVV